MNEDFQCRIDISPDIAQLRTRRIFSSGVFVCFSCTS